MDRYYTMIWFSRIVTLSITLIGLLLIGISAPFKDGPHILLAVVGLCIALGGAIFVRGDVMNILAKFKKK